LANCWLIQGLFSRNCAKEEEDSQQNFWISLFWVVFLIWGLDFLQVAAGYGAVRVCCGRKRLVTARQGQIFFFQHQLRKKFLQKSHSQRGKQAILKSVKPLAITYLSHKNCKNNRVPKQ
jgi:hypothetical protein